MHERLSCHNHCAARQLFEFENVQETEFCLLCCQIPTFSANWVTEAACDGRGIFNSDGVTDCQRCDTCPRGKYAIDVARCTGNGIWKDPFTCTDCLPCASGYEHVSECNGLSFNDSCKLCPPCPPTTYISSYWNATLFRMVCTCTPCTKGTLMSPETCPTHHYKTGILCDGTKPYDQGCAPCTTCNSGEWQQA
jgi:hypothetical protein